MAVRPPVLAVDVELARICRRQGLKDAIHLLAVIREGLRDGQSRRPIQVGVPEDRPSAHHVVWMHASMVLECEIRIDVHRSEKSS